MEIISQHQPLGAATVGRNKGSQGRACETTGKTAPDPRDLPGATRTHLDRSQSCRPALDSKLPAGNCGPESPPAPGFPSAVGSKKLQVPGCPARAVTWAGRRARLNSLHRPFCRRSRSAASSLASSPPSPPPLPPPPPSPLPASSRLPPPLSLQPNPSPGAKHLLIYFRFLATAAS